MKYVSRRYLREKWENVKWDMEKTLSLYTAEVDKVSEYDLNRCAREIAENMKAIIKELGCE